MKKGLVVIALFFLCIVRPADGQTIPNQVAIRINPSVAKAIARAFATVRPTDDPGFSRTNLSQCALSSDSVILSVLGVSVALHGLKLQPLYPTHSIAFEDIRERSNPSLYLSKQEDVLDRATNSTSLTESEEKLSRWFVLS